MPVKYDDRRVIKPNTPKEYTPELIKELMKCSKDIKYFAKTYYTIVHPTKGEMIIPLLDFQERMLDLYTGNRFSCVLSARQIGKCCHSDTIVSIKDTNSGKIVEISMSDFLEKMSKLENN
jgi:hypothetical protein